MFSLFETIAWISCSTIPRIMLSFLPNLKFRTKVKEYFASFKFLKAKNFRAFSSFAYRKERPL